MRLREVQKGNINGRNYSMAARRAANRDRASVSDQRALARLDVEVHETLRRLIVTMPGTRYAMEFAETDGRLGLVSGFGLDDKKAAITSRQFAALAERAAQEKAQELGWSARRGVAARAGVDKSHKR
jgi:hypothetical protein